MLNYTIDDWLYAQFDRVKPASSGRELVVCCPFCIDDTNFHLYVSTVKPAAYCHKCGWSGSYIKLIQNVIGTESYAEAFRQLTNPTKSLRDYLDVVEQLQQSKITPITLSDMPDWYEPFTIDIPDRHHVLIVLRYALKRLSLEDLIYYRIGYCKDVMHSNALRLVIPVERGYYQARAINSVPARKYINPEYPIEDRLFNGITLEQHDHVFINEGAISSIATGRNSIATLGANGANAQQRQRLVLAKVKRYTIIVEPEKVAHEKAASLAQYLTAYGKEVTMRIFQQGDPNSNDMYIEQPYNLAFRLQQP